MFSTKNEAYFLKTLMKDKIKFWLMFCQNQRCEKNSPFLRFTLKIMGNNYTMTDLCKLKLGSWSIVVISGTVHRLWVYVLFQRSQLYFKIKPTVWEIYTKVRFIFHYLIKSHWPHFQFAPIQILPFYHSWWGLGGGQSDVVPLTFWIPLSQPLVVTGRT